MFSYGIPKGAFQYYCYYGSKPWKKIRERINRDAYKAVWKAKAANLKAVLGLSLDLMKRELTKELRDERRLSIDELQKLASILSDVDKPLRLDNEQATEIIQKIDNSKKGISKMLQELHEADPYVDYTNAEKPKDILQ